MCNTTPEDAYKEAVKKKYEEVKEGLNFTYLSSPTRAKLSSLCWEIFAGKNMHQDDLNAFNSLLEMPFDLNTRNKFRQKNNKFRPIETFFKGETNPANIDFVDVAAILVDYKPRPFNKFRTKFLNEGLDAVDIEEFDDSGELGSIKKNDKGIAIEKDAKDSLEIKTKNRNRFFERLLNRSKPAMITTAVIFCLIAATIYFAVIKKHCMQWSEDHYEIVDCNSGIEGNLNSIIPLDENLLDFRRIKVCDTTTCFINNEAIVWYAKTSNDKADFFNTHGRHPISGKSLRPVTKYIKGKYGSDCLTQK